MKIVGRIKLCSEIDKIFLKQAAWAMLLFCRIRYVSLFSVLVLFPLWFFTLLYQFTELTRDINHTAFFFLLFVPPIAIDGLLVTRFGRRCLKRFLTKIELCLTSKTYQGARDLFFGKEIPADLYEEMAKRELVYRVEETKGKMLLQKWFNAFFLFRLTDVLEEYINGRTAKL